MYNFGPLSQMVLDEAIKKEIFEQEQVQRKEQQLADLYRYATHYHSHHPQIYHQAQSLINELIYHFRDWKIYRFLIELTQKLSTKSEMIQSTNGMVQNLKPHLGNQLACLVYAANNINNFGKLIQLRDIILSYFQTTFLTPTFEVNLYLINLFNMQFVRDIYLTQFNQKHQIHLINYGHNYTPNCQPLVFTLQDDDIYTQVSQQSSQIVYSQYGVQQQSLNPYSSYQNQQLNMTDSQFQQYQSQQNPYQQLQSSTNQQYQYQNQSNPYQQQQNQINPQYQQYQNQSTSQYQQYQNQSNPYQQQQYPQQQIIYNNQNIYVQSQNPYPNIPQPQNQGYSNSQQPITNPYNTSSQQQIGNQTNYTQSNNNQLPNQGQISGLQPQQSVNQGQPDYKPQTSALASGQQNSSYPPYSNQIASFPPTQGYQYNLQNNNENKVEQQQQQANPYQMATSYGTQNLSDDPKKEQVSQSNSYNQYQSNYQYSSSSQNVQYETFEQKQQAVPQIQQSFSQVSDQSQGFNQINTSLNNQNTQQQLNQNNPNYSNFIQDQQQLQTISISQNNNPNQQNNYQNPSNQIQSFSEQQAKPSLPPPPPPPPPPPQVQAPKDVKNQKKIDEQNLVAINQGSFNDQQIQQNNLPQENSNSLFEELFLNENLKNFQLIDSKGCPQIDQKVQYKKDRQMKGFRNHDEQALFILKCYYDGKYAQNKIDRTEEVKQLVNF